MLLRALISAALATAAAAGESTAAAAGECNKTITFGKLNGAGPGGVLSPSNWLDHGGTCFTWHRQPSAPSSMRMRRAPRPRE